jgi:hypothetical protein
MWTKKPLVGAVRWVAVPGEIRNLGCRWTTPIERNNGRDCYLGILMIAL